MGHGEIVKRAGLVGCLTLLSRIAGLIRDVAIAHAFGTRLAADAFFVAFRIPNLLRRLFAEGALTVSFVPVFTETLRKSHAEAKKVVDLSFTFLVVALLAVSAAGILCSPLLVRLTAWGFTHDPAKYHLTVTLTRIMFPYILLVSLAAWAMGILNSVKHFSSPAASPIFMNLGIILGALLLTHWFDPPVLGLAVGVLLGGLMQLATHFPFLIKFDFWPRLRWDPSHPAVKKILGMMVPAAYGAAVYQFNVIVITFLASFLPSGSVSYLWYADRIMEFPLGIFAISMATVLLPSLADHAAEKNLPALKETFRYGLRLIFFVTLPAAGGLIVLSEPIIRMIYQHGTFGPDSTAKTAATLIFFAIGLPFIAGVRVTSNAFYSLQDSRTPVRVANKAVLVNLVLSLLLMKPMGHSGLALAVSLASLFNFVMHLVDFRKKVGLLGLRQITGGLLKTMLSTLVMMALLRVMQGPILNWIGPSLFHQAGGVMLLIVAGIVSFVVVEWLLKGREVHEVGRLLGRRGHSGLS